MTDTDPLCCDVPENKRNEECYPVEIPAKDPFYALFRRRCMEFVRSASSLKGECKLGLFLPILGFLFLFLGHVAGFVFVFLRDVTFGEKR